MTATVKQLLETFDALPPGDQHEAAIEILRRFTGGDWGDVPEETLSEAADQLFQVLDHEETGHGQR